MKKCLVTILAILYLVTSTGATVHLHYCMGKLVSSGLWHTNGEKDDCPECNMAKKKGCCEDKHKTVKIESKYSISTPAVSVLKPTVGLAHHDLPSLVLTSVSAIFISYPLTNSPPGVGKRLLYISNCVYLI